MKSPAGSGFNFRIGCVLQGLARTKIRTTLNCLLKKLGKSPSQTGRIYSEAMELAMKTGREWILTKEMVEAWAYSA